MKINIIGPSYPFRGGVSHYTTLLFKNLKKRHLTSFHSFKRQYPNFIFPGRTDRDYSNFALKDDDAEPILDSLNPFTWINVAVKIITNKPDLIIIPWWVFFWVPQFLTIILIIRMFSRINILFICHNVAEHEANFIKLFLSKIILSRGDFFIVHSFKEKQDLINLIGKRQMLVTFHPTYDVFNTGKIPKNVAKRKIGIDDERVILFFGFVREYKGLKYLLEALPDILKEMQVRLLIAGEFWDDKSQYLDLIKDLKLNKSVTIIDKYIPNEEISYYFYASDIVVLPYISVTSSGLVQMAYGFKKPVIVTDIGALSEIVINKKTGFLVTPNNSSEIAETVLQFYKNGNEDEIIENIKRENYKFSWDSLIEKIEYLVKRR